MDKDEFITQIILDEIKGKNQAIHAYDKMIWTVRTGFLTLFFAGWGILLKSIVEYSAGTAANLHRVLMAMLLVSVALSVGGAAIDLNYVRRKFRVIYALDSVLSVLLKNGNQMVNSYDQLGNHVQVSGDKDNADYLKVSGYGPAWKAGFTVYSVPIILAAFGVLLLY